MNDVNAAIGIGNYPHINSLVEIHKNNGNYYNKALKNIKGVELLENKEGYESSYWIYSMLVENRKDFVRKMEEMGINVSQVHDRNDKHKCFSDFKAALPSLDIISQKMSCIPCGWWIKEEEREYIVDCIKKGW
jgi:dTDP-4-amino-4,6-dideoxygalactose transaminase